MKNIVAATFQPGYTTAKVLGLWQYDYGQILRIQGLELPDAVEIHFSLQEKGGESERQVGLTRDGVTEVAIPNSYLENAGTSRDYSIYAFLYISDGKSGNTEYKITMYVRSRPKPKDPETPENPKDDPFGKTIEAVNKAMESTKASAEVAADSAKSASESATRAEKSAVESQKSAKAAATSEKAAATSATAAAESERHAGESATTAQTAADEATKNATAAAESETTAAQQAQNAAQSATNASGSAESASQSAETAKTAADAASKSASAAQQAARSAAESASTATAAAQTATTAAGNAAESATTATQSAETAGQKATAAKTSASNAAESATAAEKSATAAGDSASAAKASETAAEEAAQTAQEQAEKIVESAEQIEKNKTGVAALEEKKADKTTLAVAERKLDALWKLNQGVSYQFEKNSDAAYQKEVPTGAKLASVKRIGGKTIVWNQLFENPENERTQACKDANNYVSFGWYDSKGYKAIIGHTYLVSFECYMERIDTYFGIGVGCYIGCGKLNNNSNTWSKIKKIVTTRKLDYGNNFYIFYNAAPRTMEIGEEVKTRNVNVFDLTKMFGSGNEPSTVEEFEAMFPEDYYEHNPGELLSASVSEVVEQGKNLFDQHIYAVSEAIRNLLGYGWSAGDVCNEIDWEGKRYIQKIEHYEFSENTAVRLMKNNYTDVYCAFFAGVENVKVNIAINGILSKNFASKYIGGSTGAEGVCCETAGWLEYKVLFEKLGCTKEDDDETVITAIKKYMIDMAEEANYHLIEPIVTDISDLIGDTFQEPFEVEAGGTLTFKNSNDGGFQIPVPSEEEYIVSLTEVGGVTE